MHNLRQIILQAKKIYPQSKFMRKQWIRKTIELYKTGKHQLLTGKMPNDTRKRFEHLIQY